MEIKKVNLLLKPYKRFACHGMIGVLLMLLVFPKLAYSQLNTMPINGTISLDQGVAPSNLKVSVEFATHTIVVSPDFSISFPVVRTELINIIIPEGSSSFAYSFSPVITGAVGYSLKIRCSSCTNISPIVYYTQNGNTYNFSNRVILDRDEVPSTANFVLRTFSTVSGSISLENNNLARKDLQFGVNAFNPSTNTFLVGQGGFTIEEGTNSTSYNLTRIPRAASPNGFRIQAVCFNCSQEQEFFEFPQTISSSANHTNINFIIPLNKSLFLPPIIDLFLE